MPKIRKGGGGKLARSETVTVRLDPKLRFAAELAARKQRRTLSSFIEWAVEKAVQEVQIGEYEHDTAFKAIDEAWDVDEADRFCKLALNYPHLLTHDEEVLWKLICKSGHFWKGRHDDDGDWAWKITSSSLVYDRLHEYWDIFKQVAAGELGEEVLPEASRKEKGYEDSDSVPF